MSSYSDYIRLQFEIQEQERDKGLTMPEDIRIWKDIRYGDDEVQILDIYKPLMNEEDGEKKLPVIVNVHGGGWVYGKKEGYQFYCMELAGKGFTVIRNLSFRRQSGIQRFSLSGYLSMRMNTCSTRIIYSLFLIRPGQIYFSAITAAA